MERFSTDIHRLSIIAYTGTDETARQQSGIVTSSKLVEQMLGRHAVRVQQLVDMIIDLTR